MEIVYVYQKIRSEFGKHCEFKDRPAQLEADVAPNDEVKENYMEKNPSTLDMNCVPTLSEHSANTIIVEFKDQGMVHEEGGWPRDIDATEPEQKMRFLKKAEKDEDYVKCMQVLAGGIEHAMRQNSAIDIYEDYFAGSHADHSMEAPNYKSTNVFKDPSPFKRCATSVCWYPDTSRVAVSYSILGFQATPEGMSSSSYIWNLENPNYPEMELVPQSPMCCLEYNPKDNNVLIGGSYNGLVAWWDTRKGSTPCECSPIEKSHRDPVYSIAWLQSKTGTECASVSTDGQVLFWDTRKMGEPVEHMSLEPKSSTGEGLLGGMSIDFGGAKFLVGTEQGVVLSCNRKAKNPSDQIGAAYIGHHGPIYSLERNPFFPKFFLTIGDWTARIWMEDIKTPIMTTMYHSNYLTAGCWSPTRPGVFFTTKDDGEMDIWDFAFKQNAATLQGIKVSEAALQSLRVEDKGRLVAVGAADGTTTILEISEGLYNAQANEKQAIGQMFEREMKREKNLEARAKELKIKAKKEAAARAEAVDDSHDANADMPDVESTFYKAVGIGADDVPAPSPAPAPAEQDTEETPAAEPESEEA